MLHAELSAGRGLCSQRLQGGGVPGRPHPSSPSLADLRDGLPGFAESRGHALLMRRETIWPEEEARKFQVEAGGHSEAPPEKEPLLE